ncbi:sensor histidine kinase [Amycolatopsis sp. YIM 10]|uniref:sensor histidine kinase n=1 Tax=Amycolatopsis sp. YIM 10 TaxID=2653857 RepID=UPI00129041A7|nr:histidine kinase [Amycolatopsis sp. YIM 10]QFU89727.1 Sensor histidine kinase DesK [Amycolatopsis sp. YIM 10]
MDGSVGSLRRGTREWVVDGGLFALASVYGWLIAVARLETVGTVEPLWLFQLDQVVGALGCAALWLRRRWPVQLAVVLMVLGMFAELVSGAMLAALFTVAVHRPPRTTLVVAGVGLLAAFVYVVVRPEPELPGLLMFLIGVAAQGAVMGWGLFIQRQRQLVTRIRAEADLRAEGAQLRAREEVAREMHDVLGHRLSLVSMHAGALEYHPNAPPAEIGKAAAVIRESAHQALEDLREIVSVLRTPASELPQPTIADIRELVAEAGRAGMRAGLREDYPDGVPNQISRTAYRIVQEALTNVRKHAGDAEVRVSVAGAPGDGLAVEVCNGAAAKPKRSPAPGQGLAGLTERVALAEGTLTYGPTEAGGWRLRAWLPWGRGTAG